MLCERCQQQEATIHLTQTRQGEMTEHHFCDSCARELGIGHSITDYFGTIGNLFGSGLLGGGSAFNHTGGIPAFGAAVPRNIACPKCGQTFEKFRHTGLFGCSQCYTAFADLLDPVFRRVQGNTRHLGRKHAPSEAQLQAERLTARLNELKQSLQLAVAEEDYEQAARLRDEIRQIKQAGTQPDEGGET
ncbi:MAG: hypothetical protein GX112_14915 [Clostridiaceae bacterium]|nr:hypothetical protein [Clostridiaceae bacterium]